jgi:phage repressor protein C with HTH and peptisase S24 domain
MEKLADEVSKAEGRKVPLSWQTVQQWEKEGGPAPNRRRLPHVAAVLGVPVRDMLIAADFDVLHSVQEPPVSYGLQPILAWEHEDDLPPGEFVMIPRLDVHLSAGAGRDQVEIEFTKAVPQAFRAEWIRERRLKPNKLAAMTASGNSMEPGICDGDSLLIDTSQTNVIDGKVYALWYDGGERVKRLFRLPGGGLRIKSDNPEHGSIELGPDYTGHVRILGRVVHRSGTGGL